MKTNTVHSILDVMINKHNFQTLSEKFLKTYSVIEELNCDFNLEEVLSKSDSLTSEEKSLFLTIMELDNSYKLFSQLEKLLAGELIPVRIIAAFSATEQQIAQIDKLVKEKHGNHETIFFLEVTNNPMDGLKVKVFDTVYSCSPKENLAKLKEELMA